MQWMARSLTLMRQAVLACIALVVLNPNRARCELYCKQPSVNAGVVYSGTRLLQSFTVVNRGNNAIEISEAKASCGCLAPRLGRRIFKPGEEGTVELEVNTLSQPAGPNSWSVRLRYQEATSQFETTLQLRANLVTEVMVQPAALVLLADKAAGHKVEVTDTRSKPMVLTEARASTAKLRPRVCGPTQDKEGRRHYQVTLEVAEDFPEGRHEAMLDLYTDDPKYPDLRVPVTIVKRSEQRLAATPAEINLLAPTGQPVPSRIVLIRDEKGQRVKIESVVAGDPSITCRWAEGPNAMATLKIQVERSLIHGNELSSAINVKISGPVRETLIIPVNCTLH
jgi:hypothetical protein